MLTIVPDALSKDSGGDRFGDQTIWVVQQSIRFFFERLGGARSPY